MSDITSTAASLVPELSKRFSEPDWMQSFREAGWTAYDNAPTPKLEKSDLTKRAWDVSALVPAANQIASKQAMDIAAQLAASGSPVIHIRNGAVVDVRVPESLASQGVIFADLHNAVQTKPELVRSHLGSVVTKDESKWAAQNAALWHGGAFLYVPRNVTVEQPFHIVYEDSGEGESVLTRLLVIGEEGSAFTFAEVAVAEGEKASGAVQNHVVEIVAKGNARITAVSANRYKKGPTHFVTRRADVQNDAEVSWVFTDIGDGYVVGLLESRLKGTGSRSTVKALGIGYGRQHLDLTASMLHTGKHSSSDIVMHGVLRQRANSIYRSSTHIANGADGAGSEQHDRMLLLDGTARADAIPMLLIDENDVQRCGHAASVGRLDENQIYYLMSRGIPKAEATRMLIWGYLLPTVEEIPSETVRNYVTSLIDKELGE